MDFLDHGCAPSPDGAETFKRQLVPLLHSHTLVNTDGSVLKQEPDGVGHRSMGACENSG